MALPSANTKMKNFPPRGRGPFLIGVGGCIASRQHQNEKFLSPRTGAFFVCLRMALPSASTQKETILLDNLDGVYYNLL
jgi:hypothetical protein